MKILSEETLELFRSGPCAWCGKRTLTDAHHLFGRGHGGGWRLDVRLNCVALCRSCHTLHHSGAEPTRNDLLALVAAREGMLQDDLVNEINRLRMLAKEYTP